MYLSAGGRHLFEVDTLQVAVNGDENFRGPFVKGLC